MVSLGWAGVRLKAALAWSLLGLALLTLTMSAGAFGLPCERTGLPVVVFWGRPEWLYVRCLHVFVSSICAPL